MKPQSDLLTSKRTSQWLRLGSVKCSDRLTRSKIIWNRMDETLLMHQPELNPAAGWAEHCWKGWQRRAFLSSPDTAHDNPKMGRDWKNPLSVNMLQIEEVLACLFLLTICSLSSQDTGAIYRRAPLVKLCGISFEASAWQKQCFPNENPIPKAGSNPRNGCMWLISQHFYLIKYNPCMCSAFLKKGRLSQVHLSPCH